MEHLTLTDIQDKLDFFCKMYDVARLVDPEHKRVLDYRNSSVVGTPEVCYDYWGNGMICDNCISIRAYQNNRSFVKLEKNEEAVLLVTAIPIENTVRPAVLELLKNATDTMLVGSGDYNEGVLFHRFIQEINDTIVRDALTSLYNRRFVDERLPVDIVEATLKDFPLSVCFFDVDNLKSINDAYGHKAGDMAIKAVSGAILGNIRFEQDWAARYGGDEFLVCLSNTDAAHARVIAERIQEKAMQIPLAFATGRVRLTLSFGLATMREAPLTAGELIHSADQDMYQAKRMKRPGRKQN